MSDLYVVQSLFRFWLLPDQRVKYDVIFTSKAASADIRRNGERYQWVIHRNGDVIYLSNPFETISAATESFFDVKAALNAPLFIEGREMALTVRKISRSEMFQYPEIATVEKGHVWRICRTDLEMPVYESRCYDKFGQAMNGFEEVRKGCS